MDTQYNKLAIILGKIIVSLHLLRKINPWRRKVVLIDKSDGLGDVLFFLPYLQIIRRHYPKNNYSIIVIARPHTAEILKLQKCADKVISISSYQNKIQWIIYRLCFWIKTPCDILFMTWRQCDLLNPYKSRNQIGFTYQEFPDDPYFSLCAPKQLIHIDGMTIYERYQLYLQCAGIHESPGYYDYTFLIQQPPISCPKQNYIVICPGASIPIRRWESEKFSCIANELVKKYHYKIVLVGNSSEKLICKKIMDMCTDKNAIIDLSGKTSVPQLFGVIAESEFLISNETGTAHIGGVLGIKTFIISGGGDYGDFVPYPLEKEGITVFSIFRNDRHCFRCMWKNDSCNHSRIPAPCIADITVEQVLERILLNIE